MALPLVSDGTISSYLGCYVFSLCLCLSPYILISNFHVDYQNAGKHFLLLHGEDRGHLETLEEFKPQSCSNLLIYVNQYSFLQTIFYFFFIKVST